MKNIINYLVVKIYTLLLKIQMCGGMGTNCYIPYNSRIIGKNYIAIGDKFYAYGNLRLEAFAIENIVEARRLLTIGNNVSVGNYCHIGAINGVEIGDNVLMGSNVLITDHMHGKTINRELQIPPNKRDLYSKGRVIIERNVFIGDGAKIMPGVKIEEGAVIGCNAVVTHDVERYAVMAGVPAVKIN